MFITNVQNIQNIEDILFPSAEELLHPFPRRGRRRKMYWRVHIL